MSESTADADLRWREKELRAAWEIGKLAMARAAALMEIPLDVSDDMATGAFLQARDAMKRGSALTPPDNLGDLVKEQTGER